MVALPLPAAAGHTITVFCRHFRWPPNGRFGPICIIVSDIRAECPCGTVSRLLHVRMHLPILWLHLLLSLTFVSPHFCFHFSLPSFHCSQIRMPPGCRPLMCADAAAVARFICRMYVCDRESERGAPQQHCRQPDFSVTSPAKSSLSTFSREGLKRLKTTERKTAPFPDV